MKTLVKLFVFLLSITVSCSKHKKSSEIKGRDFSGPTFISVYMLGSDLEDVGIGDDIGFASFDMREMLDGLSKLTVSENSNVEILIAFGSSSKKNWKGIKYMDRRCFEADAKDNIFGNNTCYFYSRDNVSMADRKVLAEFLSIARERSKGYSKKITLLWDHGSAFQGYGSDNTTSDSRSLSIHDIRTAFAIADFRTDILGFDACLMGNYEVANMLAEDNDSNRIADYLLASEELEPGVGWSYSGPIEYIGKNPQASPIEIGKKIIEAFMSGSSLDFTEKKKLVDSAERDAVVVTTQHTDQPGKTLSMIDLNELSLFTSAFNKFVVNYENFDRIEAYKDMTRAVIKSPRFARIIGIAENSGLTSDLGSILQNIKGQLDQKTNTPENATGATTDTYSNLNSDITALLDLYQNRLVVANGSDATMRGATGLSIFNFTNDSIWKNDYRFKNYGMPLAVGAMIQNIYQVATSDKTNPVILKDESCQIDEGEGFCLKFSDDMWVNSVVGNYFVVTRDDAGNEVNRTLGTKTLMPTFNDPDTFFQPIWDKSWLALCDIDCAKIDAKYITVPYFTFGDQSMFEQNYVAFVYINGKPALFKLLWDRFENKISESSYYWLEELPQTTAAVNLFGKVSSHKVTAGDEVATAYFKSKIDESEENVEITVENFNRHFDKGPALVVTSESLNWGMKKVAGEKFFYNTTAVDFAENYSAPVIREVK